MRVVFDTYAWVEYFIGSRMGKIVEKYLLENEVITPTIVLIELSCKAAKEDWDFIKCFEFIKSKSSIIGINQKVIIDCGKIYFEMRKKHAYFGLIDALILTISLNENAKILTGDKHFKNIKNVEMLK